MRPGNRSFPLALLSLVFAAVICLSPLAAVQGAEPSPERKVRKIEFAVQTAEYDPLRHDWGVLIAESWKKLGIDVEIRPTENNVMITEGLRKHNFDAMVFSWAGMPGRIDPDFLTYTILDSSQE